MSRGRQCELAAQPYLIIKGGSIYTRLITWMPYMIQRRLCLLPQRGAGDHHLDQIKFVGYAFQIEKKFAAWKLALP